MSPNNITFLKTCPRNVLLWLQIEIQLNGFFEAKGSLVEKKNHLTETHIPIFLWSYRDYPRLWTFSLSLPSPPPLPLVSFE